MNEKEDWARNVAIVGPYLSGKTTLLEFIVSVTGQSPARQCPGWQHSGR